MVFVTGATGFLGSYLVRNLLHRGFTVKALRRKNSDLSLLGDQANRVTWVTGDLLDITSMEEALDGVTKVYHAAAIVSFDPKLRSRMMKVNVEGTANVVNLSLAHQVKKLVHVSSVSALGKVKQNALIDENSDWENSKYNTNYGLSKFLSEKEVWRGIAEGLPAVIVNPSLVMGAGRWSDSSVKIFRRVANGLSFYTKGSTGYVDVRDVAECMVRLMESNIQGERFVINAENLSYEEVLLEIAEKLGVRMPGVLLQGPLIYVARIFDLLKSRLTGVPAVFTREVAQLTQLRCGYDNQKIKQVVDIDFNAISKTIEETVEKYKRSHSEKEPYAILDLSLKPSDSRLAATEQPNK